MNNKIISFPVILILLLYNNQSVFADINASAKMKGMRFDPSYYYNMGFTSETLAEKIVNDAVYIGANFIFLYSYSPVYGALYKTTYEFTSIENGFGMQDLLG